MLIKLHRTLLRLSQMSIPCDCSDKDEKATFSGGDHDGYLGIRVVPVEDVERLSNGGFAQVPVLTLVKLPQLRLEGSHVHILVVVKMAKPTENLIGLVFVTISCSLSIIYPQSTDDN